MKDRQKKTMVWDKYEKCADGRTTRICLSVVLESKEVSEFSAELGETRGR